MKIMPPQRARKKRRHGERARTSSQSSVEIQVTQKEIPGTKPAPTLVKPTNEFLQVLKTVGAKGSHTPAGEEVFTLKQVWFYLTEYIKLNELYDPFNPVDVYCKGDPLGLVFGVEKFSRREALKYVMNQCQQVISKLKQEIRQPEVTKFTVATSEALQHFTSSCSTSSTQDNTFVSPASISHRTDRAGHEDLTNPWKKPKHDNENMVSTAMPQCSKSPDAMGMPQRRRQSSFSIVYNSDGDGRGHSPWSLAVVEVQESGDESVYSVQSKETVFVESSSDDYWFVDEDNDEGGFSLEMNEQGISLEFNSLPDPPFEEEFEVNNCTEEECGPRYDTDGSSSPVEDIFVVYDSSDEEFWADSESSDYQSDHSSDDELDDNDKWHCTHCNLVNTPLRRYCDGCWTLRPDWLRETSRKCRSSDNTNTDYFGLSHKRAESLETLPASDIDVSDIEHKLINQCDSGIGSSFCGEGKSSWISSQDSVDNAKEISNQCESPVKQTKRPRTISENYQDLCTICMVKPKEASVIHGKTGHQVCCYTCAKRLKRKGKHCPVCRRPIQKVIKNYLV